MLRPIVFALQSSRSLGDEIAHRLGITLADHEEREFEDGEHKTRPLVELRGRVVYVVHSLHGDESGSVSDKLCRLLFFCAALKDASAARITAVVPYLCYTRKDRRTQPRDPVTTRYVAALFEATGIDHVVALEVHNPAAFDNAFRISTDHLEARTLFVDHIAARFGEQELAVVSPDTGGAKRAERFRTSLERKLGRPITGGIIEKYRAEGVLSGKGFLGDVMDRTVLLIDDLISTGTTLVRAAETCLGQGAREVHAVAAHGVFASAANEVLKSPALASITISDTVRPVRPPGTTLGAKLTVVPVAPLFAEAIRRIDRGESVVDLAEA